MLVAKAVGERDGEGGVSADELEALAVGSVDGTEAVGLVVAKAGPEVGRQAEVGPQVGELDQQPPLQLPCQGASKEEPERRLLCGETERRRREADGEEVGGGGVAELEEGRVALDHGNDGPGRQQGGGTQAAPRADGGGRGPQAVVERVLREREGQRKRRGPLNSNC